MKHKKISSVLVEMHSKKSESTEGSSRKVMKNSTNKFIKVVSNQLPFTST